MPFSFKGKDGTIVTFDSSKNSVVITSKTLTESKKIYDQIYKDFKTNNLLEEE